MTTATPTLLDVRFGPGVRNYLNEDYGFFSWVLTKDHKRIAILYLFSITLLFMLGGFFATMMRIELLTPEGDVLTSDTYNKFFTLHGIVMIFFFLIPVIPAVLGNFILPIQLGAGVLTTGAASRGASSSCCRVSRRLGARAGITRSGSQSKDSFASLGSCAGAEPLLNLRTRSLRALI